ncbi:hypothetical protein MGMO_45c00520 [Methyloglobulus morosus KoM1]|uniref:Uncharacterized protein n=1 Tax=Methyloglobulus morosus KoM1 TaxID=1116472 RepID=V5BHN6_9GAMM|nr:hypothetical protein [Methyloglobulus morosus]ESS72820.1 hypothetical protein MGMO_45c00520 [Methyloglobulus morosus KoM1]
MSNTWSDGLKEATRKAFQDCRPISEEGCLHMKNNNGSFGTMRSVDLLDEKWLIKDKKAGAEYFFATIDALIAGGWAID